MHAALVDSSRVVLELVAQLFTDRGDKVTTFDNSEDALKRVKADLSIDVLLTSWEVAPLTGLELCWQTRLAAGSRRPLFIMVMSEQGDLENVSQALDCGADDLIAKPVSRQQLSARLRLAARLQSTQVHLIKLAETDPLTGLYNRRAFFERMNACIDDQEESEQVCAIMFDIDFFKRVNDVHGHQVGDEVIAAVATEAAMCGGIAGRLGGEEFALIFSGINEAAAFHVADYLRQRCNVLSFEGKDGPFSITCSLGIAGRQGGETADELLHRADKALYEAKAGGRNCIRIARSDAALIQPERRLIHSAQM
jgi:diguanylate cyclase (GGDEF)-like protein